MSEVRVVAEGLRFPEGPVVLADGSVLVTEIPRGVLTRIDPATGAHEVAATCGGGPNGAALGSDGYVYVANNGGYFDWLEADGLVLPAPGAADHTGGSIQRVDLERGEVEVLYEAVEGERLVAPNDLVVDAAGDLWFTDFGVQHDGPHRGRPGVLWARADGSEIRGVVWGTHQANGIGLSPDGTRLYAAETHDGRLLAWEITGPGRVRDGGSPAAPHAGALLHDAPAGLAFDSLAVDPDGRVCVATIGAGGGLTCVPPEGGEAVRLHAPDDLTTNVCFSGPDPLVAYLTLSATGALGRIDAWPPPEVAG